MLNTIMEQNDNNQSSGENPTTEPDEKNQSSKNSEGLSLHELAANNDVEQLISKLSSPGQNVDEINKFNYTPLQEAARKNKGKSHFEVAEILLKNGANPNSRNPSDLPPIWYFVHNGCDLEILRLFLKFKADFSYSSQTGWSLLIPAIPISNLDALKFLVKDIGLDVNHRDKYGQTPLYYAASWNKNDSHYEVLKCLLEMGADPNARDYKGRTPLHSAIMYCNLRVFDLFLSYKADLKMVENVLIAFTSCNNDVEVLDKLLNLADLGLDVNQGNARGFTPLHYAVKNNCYSTFNTFDMKVIKCLLKKGANINAADNNGETPLASVVTEMSEFIAKDEKNGSYFADFMLEQTDFSVALKGLYAANEFGKFILKHLAKIKFLSIPIHPTIQSIIEVCGDNKDYFDKCYKELEVMRCTKLKNSWITFFNLLVDDRRKLKNYAGNEDLIEDYKNNDWLEMFPVYGDRLKRNVDKGLRRRKLFDKSIVLLSDCLPIFSPNHLILKDILECVLSKKHLSKFSCE